MHVVSNRGPKFTSLVPFGTNKQEMHRSSSADVLILTLVHPMEHFIICFYLAQAEKLSDFVTFTL